MGLRIHTNLASLASQRHLADITERLSSHMRRLASGKRVATASDDASGLGIANRLDAKERSLRAAQRNAEDAKGMAGVMDAALAEVTQLLQGLHELATQSANGTYSDQQRQALDSEFQKLRLAIDEIALETDYAGIQLMDGTIANARFQIGDDKDEDFLLDFKNVKTSSLGALHTYGVDTQAEASDSLGAVMNAIDQVSILRGELGSDMKRLESISRQLFSERAGLAATMSRLVDVEVAEETAGLTREQILQQGATAVLDQANLAPQLALQLLT